MSYWSNLAFATGSAAVERAAETAREKMGDIFRGGLYRGFRSRSGTAHVLVMEAQRIAMQEASRRIRSAVYAPLNEMRRQNLELARDQQAENRRKLIEHGEVSVRGYGQMRITSDDPAAPVYFRATNKYGDFFPEALMIAYDEEQPFSCTVNSVSRQWFHDDMNKRPLRFDSYRTTQNTFQTKTVCFCDLSPKVQMSSGKNLVTTQVQGRDYTRKELISGGDLAFTISGNITSEEPGVYPDTMVKKFIQIMEYQGFVNVNHHLFGQHNVTRILIKDYSLGAPECKNMQPYTFSCLAIEPDDEVRITEDTVGSVNNSIAVKTDGWIENLLEDKLGGIINAATDVAIGAAQTTLDMENLVNSF